MVTGSELANDGPTLLGSKEDHERREEFIIGVRNSHRPAREPGGLACLVVARKPRALKIRTSQVVLRVDGSVVRLWIATRTAASHAPRPTPLSLPRCATKLHPVGEDR